MGLLLGLAGRSSVVATCVCVCEFLFLFCLSHVHGFLLLRYANRPPLVAIYEYGLMVFGALCMVFLIGLVGGPP